MIVKSYRGHTPNIHPSARIAENAVIVGNVTLEENVNVWYNVVIRAEADSITVGAGTNVQDGVIIHCDEGMPTRVGRNVTIGHGAIVHSCTVGDNSMVGMGAILLSGCRVGEGAVVGGGAVVSGSTEVPDGTMAVGVPAKLGKPVSPSLRDYMAQDVEEYIATAREELPAPDGEV